VAELNKLMDVMEAEVNDKDVETLKKNNKSIKNYTDYTVKVEESNVINPSKTVKNVTSLINPPKEEVESIETLEEIRDSLAQCIQINSSVPLKSRSPFKKKKLKFPYSKLRKSSPSRLPKRLSPLRKKNLSPRRYSPLNDESLKEKEKVKPVYEQIESRSIDPVS
jgi:hypothetical protein